MLTKRKRRVIFWLSIAAFFIIAVPVLLYSSGYRLARDWSLQKTGGIFIEASQTGASIYLNGKENKRTSILSGNALIKNLTPSRHKIVIKKEGFWDWEKNIEVLPEEVSAKTALLISIGTGARIITGATTTNNAPRLQKNAIYQNNKLIFSSVQKFWELPGSSDLLIFGEDGNFYKNSEPFDAPQYGWNSTTLSVLKSKSQSFFGEGLARLIYWNSLPGQIDSLWLDDPEKMPQWEKRAKKLDERHLHVFSTTEEIRSLKPYPEYSDYLIVAMGNGVYSLEIDPSDNQNINPLYKGKEPEIASLDSETLIILDDERYIEIELP